MLKAWGATITTITCAPSRLRHNTCLQRQGQEVGLAGLAGITDVTDTFVYLTGHHFQVLDAVDDNFLKLDIMTVILYDRTS